MVKFFVNAKGYHCKKIIVEGNLYPHLLDSHGEPIHWWHHIAVALYEKDDKETRTVIIDPVLFPSRAVTVNEWVEALHGTRIASVEYFSENWLSSTIGKKDICDCLYNYSRILLSQINRDVDDKMKEHLTYKGCSCRKKHPKVCDLC